MELMLQADYMGMLFAVALLAGFIDAIAGGGGLITLPALMLTQISPIHALATNKLQGSFGTFMSSLTMIRKGIVTIKQVQFLFISSLVGSVFGASVVLLIDTQSLDIMIPIVLASIAVYFLFAPTAGSVETTPKISKMKYQRFAVPAIGFYDGMFGPGSGSFFTAGGVILRGQSLLHATATAKVLNFSANIASLVVFVYSDKVLWQLGAIMIIGNMIGAYAGSLTAIKGGERLIRPMIVTVCFVMLGRYLWTSGISLNL